MAQRGLHWTERKPDPNVRECKPYMRHGDKARISAETILKMVQLKNQMLGIKRSLHEEALIAEEKNEQSV